MTGLPGIFLCPPMGKAQVGAQRLAFRISHENHPPRWAFQLPPTPTPTPMASQPALEKRNICGPTAPPETSKANWSVLAQLCLSSRTVSPNLLPLPQPFSLLKLHGTCTLRCHPIAFSRVRNFHLGPPSCRSSSFVTVCNEKSEQIRGRREGLGRGKGGEV